jgi:hypothetical protein
MMPEGILDFADYLKWTEVVKIADVLNCQRREVYNVVAWPTDRQYESSFLMQIYSRFKIMMCSDVVGTVYDDAPNRIIRGLHDPLDTKALAIGRDNADAKARALEEFCTQLRRYCPRRYRWMICQTGNLYMRAGDRVRGAKYLLKYLIMRPWSPLGWGLLLLGLLGPRTMYWARTHLSG